MCLRQQDLSSKKGDFSRKKKETCWRKEKTNKGVQPFGERRLGKCKGGSSILCTRGPFRADWERIRQGLWALEDWETDMGIIIPPGGGGREGAFFFR